MGQTETPDSIYPTTDTLREEIISEMVSDASKAGAQGYLDLFVSSYRKLTTLKHLRADLEEWRTTVHKFLKITDEVAYVNANIATSKKEIKRKKNYIISPPEHDIITYWIKTEILDKPRIELKQIVKKWTSGILYTDFPRSIKHGLQYRFNKRYRLLVQAEAIYALSLSFRSASMAEYIVSLRALCQQSRESLILSFSGRGVVVPGNIAAHLTLRDCLSPVYVEQKAMARVAIKRHKQILEGKNPAATEPIDHVAEEFPKDPLYPEPEYTRNADSEETEQEAIREGVLPKEDEPLDEDI